MPITCLTDFIGFRGLCDTVAPASGLYINDLPNVSLGRMEAFADADAETFRDVWNKSYGRAQDNLKTDVLRVLDQVRKDQGRGGIRLKTVLDNYHVGKMCDPVDTVVAAAELRGSYYEVTGTPYMSLSIPYVDIYSNDATVATPVYIYNALTGIRVYTTTIDLVADQWNRVNINQSYTIDGQNVGYYVCYDGTGIGTYQTDDQVLNPCRGCDYHNRINICGATATIAAIVFESDLSKGGFTNGLRATLNLLCSVESFICTHRDILADALRYGAALALLDEQRDEDSKVSEWALQSIEKLDERYDRMQAIYEEKLFYALSSISIEEDGVCFECNSQINLQYNLP